MCLPKSAQHVWKEDFFHVSFMLVGFSFFLSLISFDLYELKLSV